MDTNTALVICIAVPLSLLMCAFIRNGFPNITIGGKHEHYHHHEDYYEEENQFEDDRIAEKN